MSVRAVIALTVVAAVVVGRATASFPPLYINKAMGKDAMRADAMLETQALIQAGATTSDVLSDTFKDLKEAVQDQAAKVTDAMFKLNEGTNKVLHNGMTKAPATDVQASPTAAAAAAAAAASKAPETEEQVLQKAMNAEKAEMEVEMKQKLAVAQAMRETAALVQTDAAPESGTEAVKEALGSTAAGLSKMVNDAMYGAKHAATAAGKAEDDAAVAEAKANGESMCGMLPCPPSEQEHQPPPQPASQPAADNQEATSKTAVQPPSAPTGTAKQARTSSTTVAEPVPAKTGADSDLSESVSRDATATGATITGARQPVQTEETTVAAKPADATASKPAADATTSKPAADATTSKPAADATASKPAADATASKPAADATASKPADATASKPADATVSKPADATASKPADATASKPADATASKNAESGAADKADAKPAKAAAATTGEGATRADASTEAVASGLVSTAEGETPKEPHAAADKMVVTSLAQAGAGSLPTCGMGEFSATYDKMGKPRTFKSTFCGMETALTHFQSVFAEHATEWSIMGKEAPWWSVLTGEEKTPTISPAAKTGFFESGVKDVDKRLSIMQATGLDLQASTALDFGCGLGRISGGLSRHFKKTICVDQSMPHLDTAKKEYQARKADGSVEGATQYLYSTPDLLGALECERVDFVFSIIAVQHIAAPLQQVYLEQMCDALKDGGFGYVGVPSYVKHPYGGGVEGAAATCDLDMSASTGGMQMHFTPPGDIQAFMASRGCTAKVLLGQKDFSSIDSTGDTDNFQDSMVFFGKGVPAGRFDAFSAAGLAKFGGAFADSASEALRLTAQAPAGQASLKAAAAVATASNAGEASADQPKDQGVTTAEAAAAASAPLSKPVEKQPLKVALVKQPPVLALVAEEASATQKTDTPAVAGLQGKPLDLPSATLWAMSPDQLRDAVRTAAGAGVFELSALNHLNNPTQLLQYCCPNCHSACPSYPGGPPLGLPVHKDSLMPQAEAGHARSGEAAVAPALALVQTEADGTQAADGARPSTRVTIFNDASACSATSPADFEFELDVSPKCRSFLPTGNGSEALPSVKSYRLTCANGTAQGNFYSQACASNSAKTQVASFTLEQGPGADASCVRVDGKALLIQCAGVPEPSTARGYEPLPVVVAAALAVLSAWLA